MCVCVCACECLYMFVFFHIATDHSKIANHMKTGVCVCMIIHTYSTPGQDMTKGQFLSEVLIPSFPSPRLVASAMLKNSVSPTIYP